MPKNTVHGGGSFADHPELVPLNPDGERAVGEGRLPDREKSANVDREVTEAEYSDAMSRHGTDGFSAADKMVVKNWHGQRGVLSDDQVDEVTGEAADREERDRRREEYEGRNMDDLRDELTGRGLSKTGNKAELVDRLVESDEAPA